MPQTIRSLSAAFISIMLCTFPEVATAGMTSPLETLASADPDCGCGIYHEKNKYLVLISPLERDYAEIAVKGKKRRLKWVSSTKGTEDPKKGEKYSEVYQSDNLKLILNYRATSECSLDKPENCGISKFAVNCVFEDGQRKSSLKGLKGECGC